MCHQFENVHTPNITTCTWTQSQDQIPFNVLNHILTLEKKSFKSGKFGLVAKDLFLRAKEEVQEARGHLFKPERWVGGGEDWYLEGGLPPLS